MNPQQLTVAFIDDHESVRLGLAAACESTGRLKVVFSGSSVAEYLRWRTETNQNAADAVVLDLSLGDGSAVCENVTTLIAGRSAVIIHSVADRVELVREALAAGALGVISKASRTQEVVAAVETVARGETLTNVELASAIEGDSAFADAQLSAREREALRLYAAGLPLRSVAEQLGIAFSTAKENIHRVRAKYAEVGRDAPTKVDLMRRAIEDGLIPKEYL